MVVKNAFIVNWSAMSDGHNFTVPGARCQGFDAYESKIVEYEEKYEYTEEIDGYCVLIHGIEITVPYDYDNIVAHFTTALKKLLENNQCYSGNLFCPARSLYNLVVRSVEFIENI